jgi:predicted MFS family arabinose efflux permease
MVPIGGALVALTLLIPGHAPTVLLLAASVFILGASNSVMDIAMNAHATLVERDWGTEIMSTFHSSYSFGALGGAALAGILFDHGLSPNDILCVAMLLILAVVLVAHPRIEDLRPEPARSEERARLWTNGKLLLVAALATLAIYCEFGMVEWSYKYLRDVTHATAAVATIGNGGFALGMAFSRLVGDGVIRRIGPVRTVAAGAALSCSGLLIAIFSHAPLVAMSGFIMAGLGLANVIPMLYTRAAAAVPAAPGRGVSVCGVISYMGAFIEPITIGYVAGHFNQSVGLCLPMAAFVVIGLASTTIGRMKPTPHH